MKGFHGDVFNSNSTSPLTKSQRTLKCFHGFLKFTYADLNPSVKDYPFSNTLTGRLQRGRAVVS